MNPNANPNLNGVLAAGVGVLVCAGVCILIVLAIYIFFCLSLQKTMNEIRPKNREIPSGLVWLHMLHLLGVVPIVGIVIGVAASIWDLFMVIKISGSLRKEFRSRGWRSSNESFGKPVGLAWTVTSLVTTPAGLVFQLVGGQIGDPNFAMVLGILVLALTLTVLICFIMYWVQIAGYGSRLRASGGRRRDQLEDDYDDEYVNDRRPRHDDDDDERPRRRRDEDDDEDDDRPRRRRRNDDD